MSTAGSEGPGWDGVVGCGGVDGEVGAGSLGEGVLGIGSSRETVVVGVGFCVAGCPEVVGWARFGKTDSSNTTSVLATILRLRLSHKRKPFEVAS